MSIEDKVYEYYTTGLTFKDISNKLKISLYFVRKHLKNKGIVLKKGVSKKFTLNETRFETIETEEDAYWLGMMYADGYVNSKRDVISLGLSGEDRFFVNEFKKYMQFTGNIIIIKPSKVVLPNRTFVRKESYRLDIYNKTIKDNLIKQGCKTNKTFNCKFPTLKEDLVRHFVRGYFDGDGSLFKTKDGTFRLAIIGTDDFIKTILKHSPIKGYYYKEKRSKGISNFKIHKKQEIGIFLNWLYENSTIKLPRKFNKYNEYLLKFSTTTTPTTFELNV